MAKKASNVPTAIFDNQRAAPVQFSKETMTIFANANYPFAVVVLLCRISRNRQWLRIWSQYLNLPNQLLGCVGRTRAALETNPDQKYSY